MTDTAAQVNDLPALKAQYDREGYAIFRNVIDPELVAEASRHIDWLVARHPELRPEQLWHTLVPGDPFWVRLVSDDRLLDVAQEFIGPNIALFASHYISKPPYAGQPVLWHQDGSYWPLDPMEVITLWLAVDYSGPENGCMRIIPGTHAMDLQEMRQNTEVANVLNSEIDPALVDESKAVDLILQPGDVSVHQPNIIHGSNANNSPLRRAGLTIRYIPTSTRFTAPEGWAYGFLLRGEDTHNGNVYQPRPKYVEGVHMPFRGSEAWK
jgi:ectoine hydroxylase-related dioxygenase (phytanoyl-CoA dioxygenase family)